MPEGKVTPESLGAESTALPSEGQARKDDHWRIDGDEVIRVHINPRRALFTPSNTKCPVPIEELSTKRRVNRIKVNGKGEECLIDTWTDNERAHLLMPEKWIGETIFLRDAGGQQGDRGQEASEVAVPQAEAANQGHYKGSLRKYIKPGSIWETSQSTGSKSAMNINYEELD